MSTIFVLSILIATVASAMLIIYAAANYNSERVLYLLFISICAFLYIFGYLLEITSPTLEAGFIGVRVQKMGTPFLVLLNYLFARDIYGEKRFGLCRNCLLFSLPILSLLSVQAFPWVRLYYTHIEYIRIGSIANCYGFPGPMYHLADAYNLLLYFFIIRYHLKHLKGSGKLQRQQSLILLSAILLPFFFNLAHSLIADDTQLDLTPLAVSVALVLLWYSIRIQNLLGVVPLARAKVIETMTDAFIVCNNNFGFIDANKAAKELFPELCTLMPGEIMKQVKQFENENEVSLQMDGEMRFYKITQTHIRQNSKNGGICIVFHDITEKENQLKKLYGKATFDPLMHIYNRATFFELANFMLGTEEAKERPYALLMIDLDRFKQVNDTYGHPCGDIVLESLAVMVKGHFRKNDIVGRYGGEEIVVLLENISANRMLDVAAKLRRIIENTTISYEENEINITISIGMAHSPAGRVHLLEEMLAQADSALYKAKDSGRNRTCLHS